MAGLAEEILQQSRELVEPALRSALARLDPITRAVGGYHLGFLDADGNAATGSGGKGIRAAFALLSAQAAGADPARAIPAAAACELVHNFSLLHDDIMDRDATRRHRPTAWAAFGTSPAILAGDALLTVAIEVLAEAESHAVPLAVQSLSAATRRLIAGQAADLAFETRDAVPLAECQEMVAGKTGALLACATSLGAVLVAAPPALTAALGDFGFHVGMAFQLIDDLLGIWGTPARTGKPVWSDLRARKKSLPVVAAMSASTPAGQYLRAIYQVDRQLTEDELARVAAAVAEAGGRAWASAEAERETSAALAVLDGLDLDTEVRDRLEALTSMLCERDF